MSILIMCLKIDMKYEIQSISNIIQLSHIYFDLFNFEYLVIVKFINKVIVFKTWSIIEYY